MSNNTTPRLAFAIVALVILCATALIVANRAVPEAFWLIATTLAGGGAGASVPSRLAARRSTDPDSSPATPGNGS